MEKERNNLIGKKLAEGLKGSQRQGVPGLRNKNAI
jgi:hypothetical protein